MLKSIAIATHILDKLQLMLKSFQQRDYIFAQNFEIDYLVHGA
jgi:hypothetical protein